MIIPHSRRSMQAPAYRSADMPAFTNTFDLTLAGQLIADLADQSDPYGPLPPLLEDLAQLLASAVLSRGTECAGLMLQAARQDGGAVVRRAAYLTELAQDAARVYGGDFWSAYDDQLGGT